MSDKTNKLYKELSDFNAKRGYSLNPDTEFTKALVESLVVNDERYGYEACPCRLATGKRPEDLDIICPCDYRDPDLMEYGACYCGLYVSQDVSRGVNELKPIPERRPNKETRFRQMATDGQEQKMTEENSKLACPSDTLVSARETPNSKLGLPVWRCQVCGYLCAREDAPEICPICGVAHDRFEKFM